MKIYDLKRGYGLSREELDIPYDKIEAAQLKPEDIQDRELVWLVCDTRRGAKREQKASDTCALGADFEDVSYLDSKRFEKLNMPNWLVDHISQGGIRVLNTAYEDWDSCLRRTHPSKWRVHVLGLGDVGGTLLTGLKLMGSGTVGTIGIFDLDPKRKRRWALELGQILDPNVADTPEIVELEMEDLFDCDMFVFCASRSVPAVGAKVEDVRMVQYESNSKIIEPYARMARDRDFKGIFAVVSDPVDQLCYRVYSSSNTSEDGSFDGAGLRPEQVRGYGLGVMFARASYYASRNQIPFERGRAYGPHGRELIVANDPVNYDRSVSEHLTQLTVEANLEVRETGYKPYIAPALSSGALSLINTMKGNWNDSAVMVGGIYMGCRNRLTPLGTEIERAALAPELSDKLNNVVKVLKAYV